MAFGDGYFISGVLNMKANGVITLWHFDGETAVRRVFKNVHINFVRGVTKSGIKEKGFHTNDMATIRIPTSEAISVDCGDYVRIGEHGEAIPDRRLSLKITAISDNRRGSSPHIRISCGG